MPPKPLKLLLIEDSPHDAELTLLMLERSGLRLESTLVHDHQGAQEALQGNRYDLILADYLLPGSSGKQALQVARHLAPDTPFIFVSGIFGEQHAVEMMRLGAIDYVLKQNLSFLPKAVERALAEVHERRERKRAEQALLEEQTRARLAIDAANMGTWDYAPQAGTLIWDDRCKALHGLPPETEMSLELFLDGCHPDDRARLERRVQEAMAPEGDHDYHVEYRLKGTPGSERWLSTHGRTFFEHGLCVRFSGVLQDITEQKRATESLKRLNDMLGERVEKRTRERDRTWELSRDLLAVMRADMTPTALNPAWELTLGRSRQALLHGPLSHLLHPEDLASTREEFASIAQDRSPRRFVNRMRDVKGDYQWLSWIVVPDDGLMYAAVRDITSERLAIEELAKTNRRLLEQIEERERVEATLQQMQRLEAVGQLTAGVAHDFNNLLTVILTSAYFIARDLERGNVEKARARLHNVTDAGERGAKLTGQLLAFSRRQRLVPEAVNLNDTLRGMLELLQSTLGGSILIETATAQDLWSARVDPTQTELIVLNLAINARDAMAMGGTLRLITANEAVDTPPQRPEDPEPGDYVVLSVQDTGSGMSDEVLAKAFEPFFTTKEIGKGSGLGLAQVFGFAKQSGGGARILTEEGVGTTVKVYLPSIREVCSAPERPAPSPARVVADGLQRTVLLVDDDNDVREVTALMLETLGYRVVEAVGGSDALEKIHDGIDLLLADFAMPGMNGAELARSVRQRYPELPVVFVTGYAELGGLNVERTLIVQKPYHGEELAEKLQRALQGGNPLDGLAL